jgi:predicted Zn-dependent peptidase
VTTPATRGAGPTIWSVPGYDEDTQVQVRVAWAMPAGRGDGYAERLVLAEMLNRRVAAVRERLGASYGVYVSYEPAVGPGILSAGGSVDAARAGLALAAIRGAIDEVRRGDGFLDDFVRARAAVLGHLLANASDSWSLAERLSTLATFGLPADHYDELARRIARLTPKDVLGVARKDLDPAAEVIVAEGAKRALEGMFADAKLTPKVVATKR